MIISAKELGEKIRKHRGSMTRVEFAGRMGLMPDLVRKWEAGNNYPTAKHLNRLCEVMGCDLNELLGFEQPKPQKPTKVCIICGREFVPNMASRKCCSAECSRENGRRNSLRYAREHKKSKPQKARPEPSLPPEPTVNGTCPEDCRYRSHGTAGCSTTTCDYFLITGKIRGGSITECTKYEPRKKGKRRQPAYVPVFEGCGAW